MAKTLPAPWESAPHPKMLLCHFNIEELKSFDTLQGGPSIDPSTGIREYSALKDIIKIPEVREIFSQVTNKVENNLEQHGKLTGNMREEYESAKQQLLPFHETPEEEMSPEVRQLEHLGTGGDTKLAWIPQEFAELLVEMRGEPKTNPHTGLLMFGFFGKLFKGVVRFAAPIVAVAAAPWTGGTSLSALAATGATAAGASALAHAATGARGRDIGHAALMSGITAGASPYLSGVTGWNPSLVQGLTRTGAGMLGGEDFNTAAMQGLTHGAGHYGINQLANNGYFPSWLGGDRLATNGQAATNAATAANPAAAAQAVANNSLGIGTGMMDKLGLGNAGTLLPLAGLGAAAYLGHRGDKQVYKHHQKHYEDEQRREEDRARREGYYTPWIEPPVSRRRNPKFYEGDNRGESPFLATAGALYNKGGHVVHNPIANHPLHHQPKLQSVTEGVLIKGPGSGQQDKIKTTVPENSYIIDASATSMFGDGSSDAGAAVLKRFEEDIKKRYPRDKMAPLAHKLASTKQLPVFLSDSEYKFDPLTVTMLGDGDNAHGAKMLKGMVKKLRAHKSIKGGGLPPKAGSPWDYISHNNQRRRV